MHPLPRLMLGLLLSSTLPAFAATALTTESERSGFVRTGHYDEVIALCDAFAGKYPQAVRCIDFGTTPEGRPMKALVASTSGALDPAAARARGVPVVLIQGGIHAGEIEGKDGGFVALRDLLDGRHGRHALDKVIWLFVPVFNVDGHERRGAWNRPNQRGPEEMGWRTNALNINLNRDYTKADAPEMRAMLELVRQWDPLVYVDLHTTDGAQFEHDVSVQVEPVHAGDDALRSDGVQLRDSVIADLRGHGSLPLPFYPSLRRDDDPASGFEDLLYPPRFSHGYFQLRNRFGMLVETHSWKTYPVRVRIMRNAILAVLAQTAAHGSSWRADADRADARSAALAGTPVVLDYTLGERHHQIDFRGYAYTRTPSAISGATMTRYDETRPQIWKVPLYDLNLPALSVTAPRGGYVVPAAWAAEIGPRLRAHGLRVDTIGDGAAHPLQAFHAERADLQTRSSEGRQRVKVDGRWQDASMIIPPGSLFIPIDQPKARLAMTLLEPQVPDSLLQWGLFNSSFERVEYMEAYVAEDVARAMLADDPQLRTEFETKLREDAAFAADPRARLEFFARRHASWDARYRLYPVLRSELPLH